MLKKKNLYFKPKVLQFCQNIYGLNLYVIQVCLCLCQFILRVNTFFFTKVRLIGCRINAFVTQSLTI